MITIKAVENFALETPHAPAIIPFDALPVSYESFRNIIWGNMRQLMEFKITNTSRIGYISKEPYQMAQWVYSIDSLCIAVPLDYGLSQNQYDLLFELFNLDYIILGEDLDPIISESVEKAGFPIIHLKEEPISTLTYPEKAGSDIALFLTTSGTTSKPKVVPLSHKNLLAASRQRVERFELCDCDCALNTVGFSRGIAINTMHTSHLSGGSIALFKDFNHKALMSILTQEAVTWFSSSPAVLESIAQYAQEKHQDLSQLSLRFVRASGAPLSTKLRTSLENLFAVQVIQNYGASEAGTLSTTYNEDMSNRPDSAGRPFKDDIKIYQGEILVKGDKVFSGYLDSPELNKDLFIDGWFRTGDLGKIDADGYLYIIGRIKEMINRGGEKISPYEVENYLEMHPLIKQAIVFPKYLSDKNEEVAAAIVLNDQQSIDLLTLRTFLGNYISSFKIPSLYYITELIPIGENGKYQRKKLSKHFDQFTPLIDTTPLLPEELTATEEIVKEYYEKVLEKKHISIHHNFFDIGGNSLLASLLHSELIDALEIDIPVHAFFECPDIRKLSNYIDTSKQKRDNLKFVVPLSDSGSGAPLFFIHSLDGDALGYFNIATRLDPRRPVYGVQFKFDDGWTMPLDFHQMAKKYVEEIKLVQPNGPYHLTGICMGGRIAFEIAQELTQNSDAVNLLAMFDVILPSKGSLKGMFSRSLKDFKEFKWHYYPKLFLKKTRSFFIYSTEKIVGKVNSKGHFFIKNTRAILEEAGRNTRHLSYEGPAIYYQAKSHDAKSELAANQWKALIPNMIVSEVELTHNMFNNPLIASEMATLLSRELRDKND